jgi:quercetin dioxygenase-like cupin family protein
MAWRSSWRLALVAALALVALVGGSLLTVTDVAALGPPVEHAVVSRATLVDPLEISLAGPSDFEVAMLTIGPGGTTGPRKYAGPTLVSVVSGTALRYHDSCRTTSVLPGVAYFMAPGQVDEIRNDGPVPLHVQTTSLAPAAEISASAAPTTSQCLTPRVASFSVAILTHSTIPGPLHITTDGPTDILTSRFRLQPGGATGWHSHPGGMLVSVDEGHFHWVFVKNGRCTRRESPVGSGYWEAPDPGAEVHDYRNDSAGPATFHYVGFSSSRGPLVSPQPPAPKCTAELVPDVQASGFERLRITGTRLSGTRPGRDLDITINLTRGST